MSLYLQHIICVLHFYHSILSLWETDKPTFSKYVLNFIISVHCPLMWYYDSNIVNNLYVYPTQSTNSNIKCLSLF